MTEWIDRVHFGSYRAVEDPFGEQRARMLEILEGNNNSLTREDLLALLADHDARSLIVYDGNDIQAFMIYLEPTRANDASVVLCMGCDIALSEIRTADQTDSVAERTVAKLFSVISGTYDPSERRVRISLSSSFLNELLRNLGFKALNGSCNARRPYGRGDDTIMMVGNI